MNASSVLSVNDPVLHDFAAAVGAEGPVAVEGARSRWEAGGQAAADVRLVRAPAGVVLYKPEEMTVQVRCGTTVAALDAALAAEGQRVALPRRVGPGGDGTVGGAIAVGENVVDVLGRGSVRDAVLQVRYVSAEGRLVTGGGPVVKNVSGFNLPKLMTGSLGVLGLLAEVILRTNPIPAAARWLRVENTEPGIVRDAVLRPSAVLWDGEVTWIKLEGHTIDVDRESELVAALGETTEVAQGPALPAHRWSMTPAETAALRQGSAPAGGTFVGSIGVGAVWADEPAPPRRRDSMAGAVAERAKALFDPTGRLNPGRMP